MEKFEELLRDTWPMLNDDHLPSGVRALRSVCAYSDFPTRGELATRLIRRWLGLYQCLEALQRQDELFLATRDLAKIRAFWTEARLAELNETVRDGLNEMLSGSEEALLANCTPEDDAPSLMRQRIDELLSGDEQIKDAVQDWGRLWHALSREAALKERTERITEAKQSLAEHLPKLGMLDVTFLRRALEKCSTNLEASWIVDALRDLIEGNRLVFHWLGGEYPFWGGDLETVYAKACPHALVHNPDLKLQCKMEWLVNEVMRGEERLRSTMFHRPCNAGLFMQMIQALGGLDGFDRETVVRFFLDHHGVDLLSEAQGVHACEMVAANIRVPARAYFYPARRERTFVIVVPDDPFRQRRDPGAGLFQFQGSYHEAAVCAKRVWGTNETGERVGGLDSVAVCNFANERLSNASALWSLLDSGGVARLKDHLKLRKEFSTLVKV